MFQQSKAAGRQRHHQMIIFGPTCLASTSRVMKKIKKEMEPIVFRSLKSPGLEGLSLQQGPFGDQGNEKTQEKMENDKSKYEDQFLAFFKKSRKDI